MWSWLSSRSSWSSMSSWSSISSWSLTQLMHSDSAVLHPPLSSVVIFQNLLSGCYFHYRWIMFYIWFKLSELYIVANVPHYHTCHYLLTILLGTTYWPSFSQNPNNFVVIAIAWISDFFVSLFVILLLLLIFKIWNIVLFKVNFCYCIGIVLLHNEM